MQFKIRISNNAHIFYVKPYKETKYMDGLWRAAVAKCQDTGVTKIGFSFEHEHRLAQPVFAPGKNIVSS